VHARLINAKRWLDFGSISHDGITAEQATPGKLTMLRSKIRSSVFCPSQFHEWNPAHFQISSVKSYSSDGDNRYGAKRYLAHAPPLVRIPGPNIAGRDSE
jgi:hypothetical protein